MKLLLKLKDMCYYEYNGEVVWVKNKLPYQERSKKAKLDSLKSKGEI